MQQGIKAYKKQYGLKGTTVVFATLYGPHDEFDISRSHVVSALVQKFCDAVATGAPQVEVWGDGTQTRELIYIDDQIDGLMMTSQYEGDLINIGTGIETTIRDLAESIKDLSGFQGEIFYNTNRFVGVKRKVLDISLAKEEFGWTINNTMTSLEDGIAQTIKWYRENEQSVR
jgi:nucleoside-diphosphate-sugar epimerase